MDCIFCRIVAKEAKAAIVYEDPELVAFEDIHAQAPVHTLVVPRRHIPTTNELAGADAELAGKLVLRAREIAREKGIDQSGYRIVINCNSEGGQMVYHLHLHLLGGRPLGGKLCR